MMNRILGVFCMLVLYTGNLYAQCTSGCSTTLTLTNGSSTTQNFTYPGPNQTLCVVVSGGGSATISGGTINFSGQSNATLCLGPGVTLGSGVVLQNLASQTTITNHGVIQTALTLSSSQHVVQNFGTVSGPLTLGAIGASFTNQSGGVVSTNNFVFNSGTFTNNTGAQLSVTGNLTFNSGASYSGAGSVNVSGDWAVNNGASVVVGGATIIGGNFQSNSPTSFASTLHVGGNFTPNNGGGVTVTGAATIGGNVQTNATTNFQSTLSVSGTLTTNNGGALTVTGAANITGAVQTNAVTQFLSSFSTGGNLQVNNGGNLSISGTTSVGGSTQINATTTFTGTANLGNGLQTNNGGNTTFSNGGTITGNWTNNATVSFNGSLTATGTITNNNGATITSGSGSCKTLCGAGGITNFGTLSSTSGPNLNTCVTVSGGTLTNVASTPSASVSGLNVTAVSTAVTATFTAASPLPGGYMVIRKANSTFVMADLPVTGTTYSVGNTIGGSTVVALLANSATGFSDNPGCGTFYYAVVSASGSSGTCGSYLSSSYASFGPLTTSRSASISYNGGTNVLCRSLVASQAVTLVGTSGGTFSATPAGLSIVAGTGAINTPNSSTAGTYTVHYDLAASGSCPALNSSVSLSIVANPTVTSANATSVCSNVALAYGLTASVPSTFSWVATNNTNVSGESLSAQTGATVTDNLSHTQTSNQNVTYTVTPTSTTGSCAGTPQTLTVTVNPRPVMTSAASTTVCSGTALAFGLTAGIASTFSWVATDNGNVTGESLSAQSGATLNNTLVNTTNTAQVVAYSVTPTSTANSCVGASQTVNVTVNPRPTVNNLTLTVCSGTAFTATPVNGTDGIVPAGTTYTWSAPSVAGITGTAAGTNQASITGTLTNTTNAAINVVYTVTPTSGSCSGGTFTVTVTVNPRPAVTAMTSTVCSGTGFTVSPVNATNGIVPAGTTYSWSAPSAAGITGTAAGSNAANISGTLTNTTNAAVNVVYVVTATSGSCVATSTFNATVTVSPRPAIMAMTATVCSGAAFTVTPANTTNGIVPAGTTYTWSAPSVAGITGTAAGTNAANISGTLTNTTNAPIDVVYSVTPTSGSCAGTPFSVTVTVNPRPAITAMSTTVCSANGFSLSPVNATNGIVPVGTTYSWSAPTVTGITGTTGGTNAASISGTLTNTTNAPINVVYSVTPTSGSCVGTAFSVTVTVSPRPAVSAMTATICSENSFTVSPVNTTNGIVPAGTTYTWLAPTVSGITGTADGTNAASVTGTLTNTTSSVLSVVYAVTPTSGSCVGNPFNVTVTVNPRPVVNAQTATTCSPNTFTLTPVDGTDGRVPAGTRYTWAAPAVTGITGAASGTNSVNISGTLTNTTNAAINVVYNVTPSAGTCNGPVFTVTTTVNPRPAVSAMTAAICTGNSFSVTPANGTNGIVPSGTTYSWSAPSVAGITGTVAGSGASSISGTLVNTTLTPINVVYAVTPTSGSCVGTPFNVTVTVNPYPVVAAITGPGTTCTGVNITLANATGGGVWSSSDNAIAVVDPSGIVTGVSAGTTNILYSVTVNGCLTTVSRAITVYPGPMGTPNTFGNGVWNAYVYNNMDYSTNYSGFYTTGAALTYNSTTDFSNVQAPSRAPSYQGCQVGTTQYSVRYQRTGFPLGVYRIGVDLNDDQMDILLNGAIIYSAGGYSNTVRSNVWTGTLGANSNLEIRFANNNGLGEISWNFTLVSSPVLSTGGTIAGDQVACNNALPLFGLTSTAAPVQGSCTLVPNPIQWQSSTDNLNFTNIPAANSLTYTIPTALSQTTYFRRAYRTYCDTVFSNTVTVTIYNGPQGTPGVFGNGVWNAYVYNANDYSSNYSGFYTTGSGLSYTSTTDFAATIAPSLAPTYQGCQMNANVYSIRYQRSNFSPGVYQIGVNRNDDEMAILLNGVTVYTSGTSGAVRANVWTGFLGTTTNLEIRYRNTGGPGDISWTITPVASPVASTGGTVSGNQVACSNATPIFGLNSTLAPTQGTCTLVPVPIQWQRSTDNITFADIPAATSLSYTIPGALSQTTYYRRAYRTYCDTVYSNTITVSVYSGPVGTPGVFGNGFWNAYVYNSMDYATNHAGFFTTGSALNFNTTTAFGNTQAPSLAPTYQGCMINPVMYSIRFQRTNFTPGVYQIGFDINDDNADILLNGTVVYSSGGYNPNPRANVWTGYLGPNSNLEIRYLNNLGPGQISWNFTLISPITPSTGGTISGTQSTCSGTTPRFALTNISVPVAGTCTPVTNPVQWQSSVDNVTFTNIPGANSNAYTIPAILSQTTYFRRAYRTHCDTVYSNTVTVSVYGGPQGTPGVFGNGFWNAYVYNATDFSSNFSGYYATGSGLNYNSNTDFANTQSPTFSSSYQGCQFGNTLYSVRYQRTGFPAGTYQIGVDINDDNMDIILNGVTVYSSGYNPNPRANVWTGTLGPTSNLEIRYLNNLGPGEISWNFTLLPSFTASTPGSITGNQSVCVTAQPPLVLTTVSAPSAGTCTAVSNPIQWQSSTDNVTFTNISFAHLASYTIPGPLAQTTYFRRAYRTFCDTVYSNTLTVSVYNGAQGTPNTFGNGLWNAYVYNAINYSSNYSGFFTTGSGLSYNTTSDYAANVAPSFAPTYQGCQVSANAYSVRFQRTNFPPGVYQIGINRNDDEVDIILNGVTVYSSGTNTGVRANVWTGTLGANSNLEIRYRNTGGPGDIDWVFTLISTPTLSTGGTVAGNQSTCSSVTPLQGLTSVSAPTAGTCTLNPVPVQWQSSTDNITFTNIPGANANAYTIPAPLAQTTYFRRAYRTYCDTVYSNTLTVTVFPGSQGTPGTFGNGLWNAYVYNATDFTSNYSGFYTTASGLSYTSTTDFAANAAPSLAPTYQGCNVSANAYSIRYQRTGFPLGVYRIGINRNDDEMDILVNGVIVYSSGTNTGVRANVWTGTLGGNSNLEIRYRNTGGPGDISWTFSTVTNSPNSTPGTISGVQLACNYVLSSATAPTQGNCTLVANPIQWQSSTDNVTFADIPGANFGTYIVPGPLTQVTYFRRAYRTFCDTVFSNSVMVNLSLVNGAQGTPNVFGNGVWNGYVYNATDFLNNYSGFFTTSSALSQNSTSYFAANASPSSAPSYSGCPVGSGNYSVRFQRTNFSPGVYQIGITRNDDNMDIILNGVTVYTSGTNGTLRANVWTGTLNAGSQLEIRYRNTGGNGDINWTFTAVPTPTASTPGSIAGNQTTCVGVTPLFALTSASAPVQGSCSAVPNPIQWQSSTDNVTFTNIAGANAAAYTIFGPLSQTTYFRRAYRTYCDTVFSNTVTVTVFNGAQGTPGTFGNGLWNAYVYNANNYAGNYSGFYTTASGLSYNTTADFAANQAPSLAPTYQGCQVNANVYSVRFQRTNFTPGVYQIGVNRNDDGMNIILDGVVVYTSGGNGGVRANVWTGTLSANSNLEIQYQNLAGNGDISWTITLVASPTASAPGSIAGNQAVCTGATPSFGLTSVSAPVPGGCTMVATPIQWQSSTDNVTFTNIAGANSAAYTIPTALGQTTYFRRAYRTYCDTVFSNTVTVSVYNGAQGTPGVFGNGVWNAYVYNQSDYASGYSGFFTTSSALSQNSTNDFATNASPSTAATYQGCQVPPLLYSVRYQRTNFPTGTYTIDVGPNDDLFAILLNGVTIYSSGLSGATRTNVWTGTLDASSQLEVRFNNTSAGPAYMSFTLTPVTNSLLPIGGTITGNQGACTTTMPSFPLTSSAPGTVGTCTVMPTPYQWESSTNNVTFTAIPGATGLNYTIPAALSQTTYFRRAYRTYCETVYSNTVTVTVYNGAQGTPGVFGNGLWNAYVYNAMDYSTNYSGFYTTGSALNYNTTSDFVNNTAPSLASTYQGCQIGSTLYSIRYQRTGFPAGVYQIGFDINDDNAAILLNGVVVYTSGGYDPNPRANVWTGTLGPASNLEIRYLNNMGPGQISWNFTLISSPTASLGGTIAGNQSTCNNTTPVVGLTSVSAGTQGGCSAVPAPYQWQRSTDNVTFTNIAGANALTYTIPTILSQTTYYRRAYRTYCDTVYSNTVTVLIFNGAQGTPNTFGNGLWNAYVYNANDYSSNYSGYYTTGSALSYNTTTDFATNQAPSVSPGYQGCQVSASVYSVRYQRTNFPLGVYQIGVVRNDDEMDIILNGVTVYSSGTNTGGRPNVWTGTLGANSNLEIRYRNTGGPGDINWNFTLLSTPTYSLAGTIAGNQVACNTVNPSFTLTTVTSPTQGNCTTVPNPIQWQSSTDNVSFTNIAGANSLFYTIPTILSQTTYYRRMYRTYCDTLYSNTVTVTIYNGAQGTPNTFGNGVWNAFVYNANNYSSNYSGFYTTGSGLSYNTTTDFAVNQAPSLAPSYQGCQVNANVYSVRFQRSNFPLGVYQIGINRNDDDMAILLNGVSVYSSGGNGTVRGNVWTGTLGGNSNLEIRYRNTGGNGDISWTFTLLSSPTFSSAGTVGGNQTLCSTTTPSGLTNTVAATQGTCTLVPIPYQWESSTDNITFTAIAGANLTTYTFPGPVSQTTYYRRAFRTYCDTLYSNVIIKTVTPLPTASLSYAGSPFCSSVTAAQAVSLSGTTGGTFSSAAGLSLNPGSGAITPSASTAGTYTVTYTVAAAGGCPAVSATTSVSITTLPAATISYAGSPYCSTLGTAQAVTRTGTAGGTYSSTAGLSLNPTTGAITPSGSTAGTYVVTYTLAPVGGCAAVTATANATVTALPVASISYPGSPVCQSLGGTLPVSLVGNAGGSYSSTLGLSLNSGNGDINLTSSTAGSYTVTYTVAAAGGCPAVVTNTGVTLNPNVGAPSAPSGTAVFCQGSTIPFSTSATNATGYTWSVSGSGNTISGSGASVNAVFDAAFSGAATVSVQALGCGGPTAPASTNVTVNPTGQWLGTTTNWNAAGNWCGGVPTATTNVLIPTGTVNMPQINAASFANNLTLQTGTSLTVNGSNSLTISGMASGPGSLNPSSTSTVVYNGNAAQNILAANYGNLSTSGSGDKTWPASETVRIFGTFTPGTSAHVVTGSTIEFNRTSAQNIPAFTFHNLVTSGNSAKSLTGNVTVNGSATLSNGTLAIGAHTLDLGGSIAGSGTLSGTCSSALTVSGPGATGTLNFTSGSRILGQLSLSKSASGTVVLGNDLDICTQLTLTQGNVVLGSSNLRLLTGASLNGGGAGSYVQTLNQKSPVGAGFFIREIPNGSGALVFPVGTVESYTPAYLDNIGATRDFRVRAFNMIYEHGTSGDTILHIDNSVQKTWEIEPIGSGGTPDVSITLQWNTGDEGPRFADTRMENRLYMGKNTGIGSSLWTRLITDDAQLSTSPYTLTVARITSFSKFAIGTNEEPLPVSLGELRVKTNLRQHTLNWETYSEQNSRHFEVEASTDGRNFRTIGTVEAAGQSVSLRKYAFTNAAPEGTVHYRIRFQGTETQDVSYSNVVIVRPDQEAEFRAYPNPVRDRLMIRTAVSQDEQTHIRILAADGREMSGWQVRTHSQGADLDVQHLPSGVYWVELSTPNRSLGRVRFMRE